jgi:hypothetical protein
MRSTTFLLLVCCILSTTAQKTNNDTPTNWYGWEVVNEELVWSKIYFADNRSIEDFTKAITLFAKESSVLKLERIDGETLRGTFSNLVLEFEKYGYSLIDTPFLVSRARHSGYIEIEIKEGRYKVVISNVTSFLNKVSRTKSVYVWNEDFLDKTQEPKEEMLPILAIANKNFTATFSVRLANQTTSGQ